MRDLDDKIIYSLNTSLPTESISRRDDSNPEENCKNLYETLKKGYTERKSVITNCIVLTTEHVKLLKQQREDNWDNLDIEKKFKSEQRKVLKTF